MDTEKRTKVEQGLREAGLVQVGGGTKFRYFTTFSMSGSREGYFWRTGRRSIVLVSRHRYTAGGLFDVVVGQRPHYFTALGQGYAMRAVEILRKRQAMKAAVET